MIAYRIEGERCPMIYVPGRYTNSGPVVSALQMMGARPIQTYSPSKPTLVVQNIRHHCEVILEAWLEEPIQIDFRDYVNSILEGKHLTLNATAFYSFVPANYYLRYETLQFDLDVLLIEAGIPPIILPPMKPTKPKRLRWTHFFPYDLRVALWDRYHKEMEKFGYTLNIT